MRQLFVLECKKIATSVLYWLFVIAIIFVFWLNYGTIDKEEIGDASDSSSIFYCAQDGQYAAERNDLSDKNVQNQMMLALTKKLLHSYKKNAYEYYPFDYIKEKVFSESNQNIVLKYLQEITGMDREELLKDTEEVALKKRQESNKLSDSEKAEVSNESSDSSEVKISGDGAYVSKPGEGNMNEAGRYEFQPDEWEYVENFTVEKKDTVSKESSDAEASRDSKASLDAEKKESSEEYSIQVSFQRFMEIMDEISEMIGKNSYFSRSLINLYYNENDMAGSPVTLKQHEEFYNKDQITGAFARYYCDSIALAVLLLPAFVITAMMAEDRRNRVLESKYTKPISSFKLITIRYFANISMMFLPILLLPLKSFIVLAKYAHTSGNALDIFAFPKYIIGWILPTLLFVVALSLFLGVLTRNSVSVLAMGIFWIFFKPSVEKIAGGNYELFDIVIRHNTLKGFGRMMQHFDMLVINRIFITGISFLFVLLSVWIYQVKRGGGLSFHVQEFIRYRKREL